MTAEVQPLLDFCLPYRRVIRCLLGNLQPSEALPFLRYSPRDRRGGARISAVHQGVRIRLLLSEAPQLEIGFRQGSSGGREFTIDLGDPGIVGSRAPSGDT